MGTKWTGRGGIRMQLTNSYVFIRNPYGEKKEKPPQKDGVIYLSTSLSISYYVEKIFNLKRQRAFGFDEFKNTYSFDLRIDDEVYPVIIKLHDVSKNTYANIGVTAKNKLQCVKCLEYINKQLENAELNNDYIVIISYDAISEFYCNKIYPKLNELERNIRKLLFNIYTLHFGGEYYTSTTSEDMQNKIKRTIQAKGNSNTKEVERIKKFFYSMEFSDVQQLLFSERWTIVEAKAKENFLKGNVNLNELTDLELRQAFETFTPKSD